ncbi:MAG: ABC transporter ATP-binding protein [Butyrivibrio sp.]|uniref:ABC transporter ATP-binding protein n=1 Tax=Butyrivibrio sp. TaxID=28121 RepID=UPI0026012D10|nr:ABC transporter ATP-binding protein [Butyrivibrio sp.]MCR5771172.1 ABC transporter ATP-binding protein [Butyrivibrio sp.]
MSEQREVAIEVKNITKLYKLYDKNSDRLKEALGLTKQKKYHEKLALNNIDLTVHRGETVGIIGTNGSGKSTLLKIITGVLTPTEGSVNVNGRISALLELGAGFNMEYNGIDNIYLNGMMIGFSREEIKSRMNAILDFADIGEYVYQPVKTYSSGMFVRLAFALNINIDPEILIVDEALSVGDVFFQAKCYHKFEEFKKQGKTILFVSHDLSSISKYCDRAVLINQGVKLGEGSPKEMIDIYKQVLVGQYVAPPKENEEVALNLLEDEEIRKRAGEDADEADSKVGTPMEKRSDLSKNKERSKQPQNDLVGKNPNVLEYGDGAAKITDYYITDDKGNRVSSVQKGDECSIHMSVEFERDCPAPIFAFTLKNILGIEITGTNTMFEKAFLSPVKKGDRKNITFTQKIDLQGGEYLISFGVTGYEQEDFTVYHRLYDALNLTVISDKNTVGYYDMNSVVSVE